MRQNAAISLCRIGLVLPDEIVQNLKGIVVQVCELLGNLACVPRSDSWDPQQLPPPRAVPSALFTPDRPPVQG